MAVTKLDPDWTKAQKDVFIQGQTVVDTLVRYNAPRVPSLGNMGAEAILEELGPVNKMKGAVDKLEKLLKERLKSLLEGKKELRSDNFEMSLTGQERNALDQTFTKMILEKAGNLNLVKLIGDLEAGEFSLPLEYFDREGVTTLSQFMANTEVQTMRIKSLGL